MAKAPTNISSLGLVSSLMFKLLPLQLLLALVSVANDIVSSLFASNAVGYTAMAAVGLYTPLATFIFAIGMLLSSGSQLLGGQYLGRGRVDRTQGLFVLNTLLASLFSFMMILLHLLAVVFGWSQALTGDPVVQVHLDQYLLGKAVGVLPYVLGMQLAMFLSLENRVRRATYASVAFVVANVIFQFLLVSLLQLQAFGLGLAGSLGSWVFFALLALRYVTDKTLLRFDSRSLDWRETVTICRLGLPDALSNGYYALRAFVLNGMILAVAGTAGLSAYSTVYAFMFAFWALPDAMVAVSRMLMGVYIGEEDRQSLVEVMRSMFRRYVPLMIAVSALVCLCAEPLTNLYYHDPTEAVYQMTVWGFRIFPWCMPLSVIALHFVCYGNAMNKPVLVHTLLVLDGFACVLLYSALLMPDFGLNAAFASYVLRGMTTCGFVVLFAWCCNGRFPRSVESLMVIPPDFGAGPDEGLDLRVCSMEEVVTVSQRVRAFCEDRGVDSRRRFMAGLCLEEMAGNVVSHGFAADGKRHSVDIRVVCKGDHLILRIKDDCVPFDPSERKDMMNPEDRVSNIGIRVVYAMASSVGYQRILGSNVVTIRV